MPDRSLRTAYTSLGQGDPEPLLAMLGPGFEWIEPDLAGYPLAGVHRGPEAVRTDVIERLEALFEGFAIDVAEVVEAGDRTVVTGSIRGRPSGAESDWELPFAHVWELEDGEPVRASAYFDRSRLTLAASRLQLAEVADDLLEQAAEIRRQWDRLGDTMRAAAADAPGDEGELQEHEAPATASVRLAAVDMAQEGATREEVDAYLREEMGVEDPAAILDEVFGPPPGPGAALDESEAALEATRLSRLFARNRG